MGQALYRKYRSKKLSEIVGQEHITKTLERALKHGKISHAYLFTGPKGVGKTSIARILAHEINGLPYTDERMHLDIIEIDAASNRRIDEIRDLREKVHIAPTSATYKVYIIDEVHMLTKEAFNALLKTLEEPPAHVVFILATTEIHKLPETIISRTQRFTFKPIHPEEAIRHLQTIAEQEGMKIDKEALELLAQHSGGSFRDSISLLDQIGHSKKTVTKADAETLIGIAAPEHIARLASATLDGTPADIIDALDQLITQGIGPTQAAKQMAALIRSELIHGKDSPRLAELLSELLKVSGSAEPQGQLEVALFKTNLARRPIAQTNSSHEVRMKQTEPAAANVQPAEAVPPKEAKKSADIKVEDSKTTTLADNWWQEVLQEVKSLNNTLYGVLRMAQPHVDKDTLRLTFGFLFHQKKLADAATQTKIRNVIKKVTGTSYTIEAVHDKNMTQPVQPPGPTVKSVEHRQPSTQELASITTIFGGGEVLET